MKLKNRLTTKFAGACAVALVVGSAQGLTLFDGVQGDLTTIEIDPGLLLEPGLPADVFKTAEPSDAMRIESFPVARGEKQFDLLLDSVAPMPGVFGNPIGAAIMGALEREAVQELKERQAEREAEALAYKGRAFRMERVPRNYRGMRVDYAAPVRYEYDFEDVKNGPEWVNEARVTEAATYTRFLGPIRSGEQVLNLRVDPGEAYTLAFDLYLIGVPAEDFDPKAELKVMVDGEPLAELGFEDVRRINARLNGASEEFDPDIARDLLVPFVSTGEVIEVCFCSTSDALLSPGSWGIDNVRVDRTPTNPGMLGEGGGGAFASSGGGGTSGESGGGRSFTQPHSMGRPSGFAPTPGSGGGRRGGGPFDFSDFFDPPSEEEPPEDPTDDPRDEDPFEDPPTFDPPDTPNPDPDNPPEPEVPAPGTLILGPLVAAAAMRRRRS